MPQIELPKTATDDFANLVRAYQAAEIEFPQLKAITYAQWALESGWGTSSLAFKFKNYGGAKWRTYMAPWATPVKYVAHDGMTQYCLFPTHEAWIAGYWGRLDKESMYAGWRGHTTTGRDFINFIGPIWLGMGKDKGAEYVRKVTRIHDDWQFADVFNPEHDNADAKVIFVDWDGLHRLFPDASHGV